MGGVKGGWLIFILEPDLPVSYPLESFVRPLTLVVMRHPLICEK